MESSLHLPAKYLRNQAVYRTLGRRPAPVVNCGFMLKPTSHLHYVHRVMPDHVVVYVLRGSGVCYDACGKEQRVVEGDFIQLPARKPHGVVQDPDGRWAEVYLTLCGSVARTLQACGWFDQRRMVLSPGIDLPLLESFEQVLEALASAPDSAMPRTLVRALDIIARAHELDQLRSSPDPRSLLVERACRLLADHADQRDSVEKIISPLGIGYERFRKVFREHQGMSPGEYRIRRRIDRAQALIAQERLNNKEIAYRLGYPDPFTFSRQFRQFTGISPDAFRKRI